MATWDGLQCVIVVFHDHTHFLYKFDAFKIMDLTSFELTTCLLSIITNVTTVCATIITVYNKDLLLQPIQQIPLDIIKIRYCSLYNKYYWI